MSDHHLPNTYRGIEDPAEPAAWTNLPPGYRAIPMDHAADLEAALLSAVDTAALSIDYAASHASTAAVITAAELNAEGFDNHRLHQLIACLALCLRRAHQESAR